MTNAMRIRDFDEIKSKTVTVVSFDNKGKRVETYGNLNYKQAIEHILKMQKMGANCIIVDSKSEEFDREVSRERQDYDKYIKR